MACSRTVLTWVLAGVCIAAFGQGALGSPGDLDATFGSGGKVTTPIGSSREEALALAVQPDGRIVLAGFSHNSIDDDFALVRYDDDGALDATFGTAGKVTTSVGSSDESGRSLALAPDGKIVAAGDARVGSQRDLAVVRYHPDGQLDPAFGGSGKVTTPIGDGNDLGHAVAIQADGKIVVVGSAVVAGTAMVGIVRYLSDGSLDGTFGSGGKVTTDVGGIGSFGYAVALQADHKIIVAGAASMGAGSDDIVVLRYHEDGTLDASFGSGGIVTTPVGASVDSAYSVALQPDGGIVVAGGAFFPGGFRPAVVRYESDGTLDVSFGAAGIVTTPIPSSTAVIYAIALQANGSIVGAGYLDNGSGQDILVIRYDASGALDASFGGSGTVVTPIASGDDVGFAIGLQADGGILVAGRSHNGANYDFSVVRYEGDPICGNAVLEAGEDCDDGNVADGDCCSATCDHEAPDSSCTADADACTIDRCDGSGACVANPEPLTTCASGWTKGALIVKESVLGKERFLAKLLKGPALAQGDFGNPTTEGGVAYTICLFNDMGALAGKLEIDRSGDQCAGRSCWKGLGTRGYRYADKDTTADGVANATLVGGALGKSRILLKAANNSAKGLTNLPTGTAAALSGSTSATVQIHRSDFPACFSMDFNTVRQSAGGIFKAK